MVDEGQTERGGKVGEERDEERDAEVRRGKRGQRKEGGRDIRSRRGGKLR